MDLFKESISNKQITTYSSLYTKQTQALDEQENSEYKHPEPSKKSSDLRAKTPKKHPSLFNDKLEKSDRIKRPPNRLTIDKLTVVRRECVANKTSTPYG